MPYGRSYTPVGMNLHSILTAEYIELKDFFDDLAWVRFLMRIHQVM